MTSRPSLVCLWQHFPKKATSPRPRTGFYSHAMDSALKLCSFVNQLFILFFDWIIIDKAKKVKSCCFKQSTMTYNDKHLLALFTVYGGPLIVPLTLKSDCSVTFRWIISIRNYVWIKLDSFSMYIYHAMNINCLKGLPLRRSLFNCSCS